MQISKLYVLAAALLFSTGGTAIKLCGLSGWQVAGFRSGVAAVLLWCLMPAWRRWWHPPSLVVGVAFGTTFVLFVVANTLTTAASVIFLEYSAPLYVLLIGPWVLGEQNRRDDYLLMGLLAAGTLFFFIGLDEPTRTAPDPLRGNLLGAGAGLTWALTLIGLRWLSRRQESPGADGGAIIAGNLIAFVGCLPAALPVRETSSVDWLVVAYLGAFQVAAAYLLLVRGTRTLRAFEVALLLAMEPVGSSLLAWLVHGEVLGVTALVGCALIFCGVVLQAFRKG